MVDCVNVDPKIYNFVKYCIDDFKKISISDNTCVRQLCRTATPKTNGSGHRIRLDGEDESNGAAGLFRSFYLVIDTSMT